MPAGLWRQKVLWSKCLQILNNFNWCVFPDFWKWGCVPLTWGIARSIEDIVKPIMLAKRWITIRLLSWFSRSRFFSSFTIIIFSKWSFHFDGEYTSCFMRIIFALSLSWLSPELTIFPSYFSMNFKNKIWGPVF